MKIGIIGPESTGKSSLGQWLAVRTNGLYIPEYAREYVENLHTPYTYTDVSNIAKKQIEQLFATYDTQFVFFDTELIITKVWFEDKYNKYPNFLDEAIRQNPIDFYFLCNTDIPFVEDPTRENPFRRNYFFDIYKEEIEKFKKPYFIVSGLKENRFENCYQQLLKL